MTERIDDDDDVLSVLYHALRTARRRHVIQFLRERGTQATTRDLARSIASEEEDVPERQATGEPYRNAYNALSRTHLPALSQAGIIIYDSERQTVLPGANFQLAVHLMDTNALIVDLVSSLIRDLKRESTSDPQSPIE
ncbi:hypothetical protein BRC64_05740 [Halobacteriales archaeon QH_10_67_22]|nr:MAG: hypothetical protein BRC64_05740 [Halobacteriales archaeon QH_10_67_22]